MQEDRHQDLKLEPPDDLIEFIKHSRLGIASTIISAVAIILTIVVTISLVSIINESVVLQNFDLMSPVMNAEETERFIAENPEFPVLVLLFLLIGLLILVGGILGLISLFIKKRRKLYPILGTILNFFGVLITFVIVLAVVR